MKLISETTTTPTVEGVTKRVNRELFKTMIDVGITQSELSRRLNISREAVSTAMGNPYRDWKICTLEEYARALGCELVIEFRIKS